MEAKEIQYENLRALVYGERLNPYQRALAISEFEKLIIPSSETPRIKAEAREEVLREGEFFDEEKKSELICNTVAKFMQFLEGEGLEMKDEYYEEFLGA